MLLRAVQSRSRERFSSLLARPETAIDLAEGALLIACEEYAELSVPSYLGRLEALASELGARLGPHREATETARALSDYFFNELGFRGNLDDYYDPRNSFLNDVIDRRIGIPITLCALYIEVARRAGLSVLGVGLPGHFIVKLPSPQGDLLVDPFHGGAIVTREDCQKRLDRIFGGKLRLEAHMLEPVGPKQILARMLSNLKAIYVRKDDHPRTLGILELLLRLEPENAEHLRDRGLVFAALDCYGLAVRDLEAFLVRRPGSQAGAELRGTIAALKAKAARLN